MELDNSKVLFVEGEMDKAAITAIMKERDLP